MKTILPIILGVFITAAVIASELPQTVDGAQRRRIQDAIGNSGSTTSDSITNAVSLGSSSSFLSNGNDNGVVKFRGTKDSESIQWTYEDGGSNLVPHAAINMSGAFGLSVSNANTTSYVYRTVGPVWIGNLATNMVTGTNAETLIGIVIIPAGTLLGVPGEQIRIKGFCSYANGTGGTVYAKVHFGGTNFASHPLSVYAQSSATAQALPVEKILWVNGVSNVYITTGASVGWSVGTEVTLTNVDVRQAITNAFTIQPNTVNATNFVRGGSVEVWR